MALSSRSSDPECNDWDPTGKTPDEIVSVCADYERGQRSEMAKRRRRGVEGTLQDSSGISFTRTMQ